MKNKVALMAAAAALCLTSLAASAQNYTPPREPNDYYSQSDRNGSDDRSGSEDDQRKTGVLHEGGVLLTRAPE